MMKLPKMKYGIACLLAATSAHAQSTAVRMTADAPALISKAPASSNLLRALDSSLETVISKVSLAVVQIVVNGYGPSQDHGHATARIVRQHAIGTGIIVDPDGYIMTNAHVVGRSATRAGHPAIADGRIFARTRADPRRPDSGSQARGHTQAS